jgi:hypothetical protein
VTSPPKSKTTETTVRQQYRIPPSLVEKAKAIARREKITTSEVVRRALEAYEGSGDNTKLEREMRGIRRLLVDLTKANRRKP